MKTCKRILVTFLYILLLGIISTPAQNIRKEILSINNTFKMIEKLKRDVNVGHQRDIVLVLGETGSGKSTFTQLIANASSRLESIDIAKGMEEYIISDHNNKIGDGYIRKTLFPDKIIDHETGTAYYDCPSFDNYADASVDIISMYTIKRIIDDARNVKLVLIVPHSAVNIDERLEFMQFLKHLLQFIKYIGKYKESIILVVTKVKNNIVRDGFIKDEDFIEDIVFFLKETIHFFEKQNEIKKTDFNQQAIELIKIFLKKEDSSYVNIEILRKPNKGGSILNLALLLNEKKRIKTKIDEKISFEKIYSGDFNYILADSTKNQINKLINKFNQDISDDILESVPYIIEYIEKKINVSYDIYKIKEEIIEMNESILKLYQDLRKTTKFGEFIVTYIEFLNKYGIKSARSLFLNFLERKRIFTFLEEISNIRIPGKQLVWIQGFRSVLKRLSEYKICYHFLTILYEQLFTFMSYDTAVQYFNISDINILLQISGIYDVEVSQNIKEMMRYDWFQKELNDSIKIMKNNTFVENCENNSSRVIIGDFIRMSKYNWNNTIYCNNTMRTEIYALDSVLVDVNSAPNMFIVAPEVHNVSSFDRIHDHSTQISIESNIINPNFLSTVSHQLINYKSYLLSQLNDRFRRRRLLKFYFQIDNETEIIKEYEPFTFLNEFLQLHDKPHSYLKGNELYNCYQSFLSRISRYCEIFKNENSAYSADHQKLLDYLYTAALSKSLRVKNSIDDELIVDIRSYFGLILQNINKLKEFEKEAIKEEYHLKYTNKIKDKITEIDNLIKNEIEPTTKAFINNLNESIDKLRAEMKDIEEKLKENIKELEMNRVLIIIKTVMSAVIDSIACVTSVLELVPGIGQIATAVNVEMSVMQLMVSAIKIPEGTAVSMPEGLYAEVPDEISQTDTDVSVRNMLDHTDTQYGNLTKELVSMHYKIFTKSRNSLDAKKDVIVKKYIYDNVSLEESGKRLPSRRILDATATLLTNLIDNIKSITDLDKLIKEEEQALKTIQSASENIKNVVLPLIKAMKQDLEIFQNSSENQNRIELTISNWQIQTKFNKIQRYFSQITQGFQVHEEVISIFNRISSGINLSTQMFDSIQKKTEQRKLSDFINVIHSDKSVLLRTSNNTINKALRLLEKKIKLNVILDQYDKAIVNFKQYVFPFAHLFMVDLPEENYNNIDKTVNDLSKNIDILKSKIEERNYVIKTAYDTFIHEEYFGSELNYQSPFYVWDSDIYSITIKKFLSGEKIVIKPHIFDSPIDKNAIKFSKIHIALRSKDRNINKIIKRKLQHFDIKMKHHGDSYYRCDNDFYLIFSDSIRFYFSFAKKRNGEPIRVNNVYTKLMKHDYILSPYATWSLQLATVGNSSFHELDFMHDQVDLELSGDAQYISSAMNFCGENVAKYYKSTTQLSVTDNSNLKK